MRYKPYGGGILLNKHGNRNLAADKLRKPLLNVL